MSSEGIYGLLKQPFNIHSVWQWDAVVFKSAVEGNGHTKNNFTKE